MKRILIIVVIAGLLLPSCMKYQDIKFLGVDHVRIGKLGMNESTLDMNLVFNNPNRMGATINNARGQAWIQDIYIGDFLLSEDVKIPASSNFSVPVSLKLNLKDLVKNSLNLITRDSIALRVDGSAQLSKGGIIKNFPLRYSGRQSSQQLLGQLRF
ncbi:LEA type 2 family protein [Niabella soli]|nr:LEA type 2 family protein [Niabella soli]